MARLDADSRRRLLVEATVKVVAEYGAAGATTRRIAQEAGFPLASLHYAFDSKDELFAAVFEELWEPQKIELPPATASSAERAAAVLRRTTEWLLERPQLARAQAELFLWGLQNNPELSERCYEATISTLKRMFRQVMGDDAHPEMVEQLARLNEFMIDGLLTAWFCHKDDEQFRRDAELISRAMSLTASALANQFSPKLSVAKEERPDSLIQRGL